MISLPTFFAKSGAVGALVVAVLIAASILLAGFAVAPPAQGQEDSCDQLPYNERITANCVAAGVGDSLSGGGADPTPVPNAEDADDAGDADDADDDSADGDAVADRGRSSVDRGDRGSRAGIDQVDDLSGGDADEDAGEDAANTRTPVDEDAGVDGSDGAGASSDSEAANTINDTAEAEPGEEDESNRDEPDGGDEADQTAAQFDFSPDPPDNNAPLMAGAAGLVGLGAVLYLAATRNRRSSSEEAS